MNSLFLAWEWNGSMWIEIESIPVSNQGFRYGASVFETIFIKNGNPVFWDEHILQFQSARKALANKEIGQLPEPDLLKKLVKGHIQNQDALFRLVATEGNSFQEDSTPQILIAYVEKITSSEYPLTPATIVVFPEPFSPVLHGHKTGSYLFHLRAKRYALDHQADESVLARENRDWVSASMANIFLVRKNKIFTPRLVSGARNGTVRTWLSNYVEIVESDLTENEFLKSEGVFLTNSRIGIREVSHINEHPVSRSDLIPFLQEKYKSFIEAITEIKH